MHKYFYGIFMCVSAFFGSNPADIHGYPISKLIA